MLNAQPFCHCARNRGISGIFRDVSTRLDMTRKKHVVTSVSSRGNIQAFRRSLLHWFRHNGRDLPWRRTRDPYAILVSEFMLQQTQVATVIPYFDKWLRRFPDFGSLARASQNDVLHAWQGLGYYNRARNLHAAARTVHDQHRGSLPDDIAA